MPYRKTHSIVFIAASKWSETEYLKNSPNRHTRIDSFIGIAG